MAVSSRLRSRLARSMSAADISSSATDSFSFRAQFQHLQASLGLCIDMRGDIPSCDTQGLLAASCAAHLYRDGECVTLSTRPAD